jgi:DNA-binding MarR family transcriptional regulator
MSDIVNLAKVERKSLATARSREAADKHEYFVAVAQFRYVLRKVFRLIDEQAKKFDLEALSHQALLQVYGSTSDGLRVSELADRLDIVPAFASNLIKKLIKRGLLKKGPDASDLRVTRLHITARGREICNRIDSEVRPRVDYFTRKLTAEERETAVSTLMFYVGPRRSMRNRK